MSSAGSLKNDLIDSLSLEFISLARVDRESDFIAVHVGGFRDQSCASMLKLIEEGLSIIHTILFCHACVPRHEMQISSLCHDGPAPSYLGSENLSSDP